jgi:hypothetical protein
MITRKIPDIEVRLSPEELASEFCRMDNFEHAKFFNAVAILTAGWEMPFCFQLQAVLDSKKLEPEGKRIMEQIGEYGKDGEGV